MSAAFDQLATSVHGALQERLRRHKLVFVQHGAVFAGVAEAVWSHGAMAVVEPNVPLQSDAQQVHVRGLERFATGAASRPSLGEMRQAVGALLGSDVEVCLWSTAPRVAFAPVPGSSLIDDASPFFLDLMELVDGDPESVYPAIHQGASISEVYRASLAELGVAVLASLDRAIYDGRVGPDTLFEMLDAREIEALRGAGLVCRCNRDQYALAVPLRFSELREQLAATLAAQLEPQKELSGIAEDLWTIERSVRLALRRSAVEQFGAKWRVSVLHGDLGQKVLERAMVDGFVSVKSVKELRDPIEWLSLGELVEVVTSARFDNLGLRPVFWAKFSQDVVPVRNRLSHMRNFKHGDRGVVRMWVSQIARDLG